MVIVVIKYVTKKNVGLQAVRASILRSEWGKHKQLETKNSLLEKRTEQAELSHSTYNCTDDIYYLGSWWFV